MNKRIVLILFCWNALHCIAQTDTTTPTFTYKTTTEVGKPDGTPNSKQIGTAGGQIISDDGRIELNFPAGALTTNTTITIQPTTNNAPNGSGKAYMLEPSGTKFKKPVEFKFHYSDEEALRCPPELKGFAQQDHTGKWTFDNYESWDSVGKTLTGHIEHFSGLTSIDKLVIHENCSPMMVTRRCWLPIVDISKEFRYVSKPGMTDYVPALLDLSSTVEWFVNDIRNGNNIIGTMHPANGIMREFGDQVMGAHYQAPDIMPVSNPVRIVAAVHVKKGKGKVIKLLYAQIRICDAYKVKVEHTGEYRVGMDNEVSDSASFVVWVHPKTIFVLDIKNSPPWISKTGRGRVGCQLHLDVGRSIGPINITNGVKNVVISKESPPEVLFDFLADYNQPLFTFWWVCRSAGVTTDPEVMPGIPVSPEINFLANGQPQVINVQTGAGQKYKVTVKPYRQLF